MNGSRIQGLYRGEPDTMAGLPAAAGRGEIDASCPAGSIPAERTSLAQVQRRQLAGGAA